MRNNGLVSAHKEKIKQLKNDVDVLTLTATPIPRTLHMSLDRNPGHERAGRSAAWTVMPIQTYVMEYNEEMVREAIEPGAGAGRAGLLCL